MVQSLRAALVATALALLLAAPAAAQDDLCKSPAGSCSARVPKACLDSLGAGAVAVEVEGTGEDCPAKLSSYRECLILVVQQCENAAAPKAKDSAAAPPEACPRDIELRLWDAIKDSDDPTLISHFLETCKDSALAPIATAKLASLEAAAANVAAAATLAICPTNFSGRSGSLTCLCPPEAMVGSVWGSGLYTADSSICRAALHAGVVEPSGGPVELISAPGQPAYSGTSRNGVNTSNWGSYQASFLFPGAADAGAAAAAAAGPGLCPASFAGRVGALECVCQAAAMRGAVWGSGVYTADSSICRAALHAGAITTSGGLVRLRGEAGLPSYQGTLRNGVRTSSWGAYQSSFRFDGVEQPADGAFASVCPADVQHLRGAGGALTCACPPGAVAGSIWGDGVYTDDSSVCRAALHAGRIGADGGEVTLEILPGQSSYAGAARNGVSSSTYGAWGGSYRFVDG